MAENLDENARSENAQFRKRSARKPLRGGKLGSGLSRRTPSPTSCRSSSSGSTDEPLFDARNAVPNVRTEHSSYFSHPPSPTSSGSSISAATDSPRSGLRLLSALGRPSSPSASAPPTPKQQHQQQHQLPLLAIVLAVLVAVALTAFAGASAGAAQHQPQHQPQPPPHQARHERHHAQREPPAMAPPHVSNTPFFHSVALGEPFEFELDVAGAPPPRVQWRLNGVNLPGKTSPKLSVPASALADSGTYTCVLENAAGRLVWEEAYLTVVDDAVASAPGSAAATPATAATAATAAATAAPDASDGGDSARVRQARTCLLRRAPDVLMRAAAVDGGAALIAAGDATGYLACFPALAAQLSPAQQERQARALDLLRSMHGTSKKRSLLVNVLAALDDAAARRQAEPYARVEELTAQAAFETGLYCASTPRCAGMRADGAGADARARVVGIVLGALA